jgi:glycosyltransferase involved in cell wall biosynthesis
MRIIHIVSSISSINFGVWNAATFGSIYLKEEYGLESELWICTHTRNDTIKPDIPFTYFENFQMKGRGLKKWLSIYSKEDTILVTHGTWLQPTFIGYRAKKQGFRWVYLSQGMFEPWALQNGWLKKKIYFTLFEKRMAMHADIIRAVSKPEKKNLENIFNREISLIYNGVKLDPHGLDEKPSNVIIFLFLGRLHHKKGILPLVNAWNRTMKGRKDCVLKIIGPDEGELGKITPFLVDNIEYLGPLFGEEKKKNLQQAHYYVLPTFSEGFPSSVVEAMSFGAIPVISEGCNFPDIFEHKLGYQVTTEEESIGKVLIELSQKPFDHYQSRMNRLFVENNLTEKIIGDQLFKLYKEIS